MKFKIQNFALFEQSTTFDLAPLTLLIGANCSGKSTFLKALDIAHGIDFQSKYFDLNAVTEYLNESTQIEVPVFKNLNLRLRFKGFDFRGEESFGYVVPIVEYVDLDSKLVLSLKFGSEKKENQSLLSPIILDVDLMKFRDLIIDYHDSLGVTKKQYEALSSSTIPIDISFYWFIGDEISKQRTLDSILELFNLKEEIHSKELTTIKFPYGTSNEFLNEGFYKLIDSFEDVLSFFFEKLNPNNFNFIENYDTMSLILKKISVSSIRNKFKDSTILGSQKEIFRTSKFGHADRIYFGDHPFFQILKDFIYCTSEDLCSKLIGEWFVKKWMQRFFSTDTEFDIKISKDKRLNIIAFEYELGSKDLVEWGTGAYRVIQLMYILARHLAASGMGFANLSDCTNDLERLELVLSAASASAKAIRKNRGFLDQSLIVFEEPEMNLHPDYQCILAEMFFDFSLYHHSILSIETHSEYMIRTFQYLRSKEDSFSKEHCSIINFGFGEHLGKVKNIKIQKDGSLSDSFYSGFMNHSQDLELKLLAQNRKISSN